MLRRLVTIAAIGLLSACSTIDVATTKVDMTRLSQAAYAARATYVGAMEIAALYTELERCGTPKAKPVCSDQAVVNTIRSVAIVAKGATENGEAIVRTVGIDPTVADLAVTAAVKSADALKLLAVNHKPKGT